MLTVTDCRKQLNLTRSAIWLAIKNKKLKAHKYQGKWLIHHHDLKTYIKNKWDRSFSKFGNELLYDKSKGEYSVKEASILLQCPQYHIYYACYTHKIAAKKKKAAWVINLQDIEKYKGQMKLGTPKEREAAF